MALICADDKQFDGRDVFCVRDEHESDPWHLAVVLAGGTVQTVVWCEHCGCMEAEHLTDREMRYSNRIVELPDGREERVAGYCRACLDCPSAADDADSLRSMFSKGLVAV